MEWMECNECFALDVCLVVSNFSLLPLFSPFVFLSSLLWERRGRERRSSLATSSLL